MSALDRPRLTRTNATVRMQISLVFGLKVAPLGGAARESSPESTAVIHGRDRPESWHLDPLG